MKKIIMNKKDIFLDDEEVEIAQILNVVEAIIPAEVKEWGGSAHVPFQKKFIGRKVKVIILKEK